MSAAVAVLVAALACLPERAVLGGLANAVADLQFRLRGPLEPGAPIAIVDIDEAGLARFGGFPLERTVIAAIIDRLDENGAAIIVPDILLADSRRTSPGADAVLARSIEASGRVLLPFAFTFGAARERPVELPTAILASAYPVVVERAGDAGPPVHPTGVVLPDAAFLQAEGFGHVNIVRDTTGGVRSAEAAIRFGELRFPFLPVVVAARALKLERSEVVLKVGRELDLGGRTVPLDRYDRILVNQYGPDAFHRIDAVRLLDGEVGADEIAGRIAYVSVSAAGVGDQFRSAYALAVPGTALIATVTDNLATGRSLRRPAWSDPVTLVAAFGLALVASFLIVSGRAAVGIVVAVAGVAAWAVGGQLLFERHHIVVSVLLPAVAAVLAAGPALAVSTVAGRRRRARELDAAKGLAAFAPALSRLAAELGAAGTPRTMLCAVVFADVKGFTRASASRAPEEVHALMRTTVGALAEAAGRHGGAVVKTLGDGAMIVFGASDPGPDAGARALGFVRDMAESGEAAGADAPDIRFGAHFGPVSIGLVEVGAAREIDVAGDTVNVASRLQALTRKHDAAALVSDQLVEAAIAAQGEEAVRGFRKLPRTRLRGRDRTIGIRALPLPDVDTG